MALDLCSRLLSLLEDAPAAESLQIVHRALAIDPLADEFNRELILRLVEAGEPAQAAAHYRLCEQRYRELGLSPPVDLAEIAGASGVS